ncbi:UDP-3-O-acyl-N-acetylglucosamine deacetylase [Selenihalanaerobacter shriftii]|uniref:UDP-3-O-acyl-N-acetylglucosamine deacetylase n=1 Tax=Selenihalanaerobacter shriftii TaxID=142842 RepID=A0A1T4KYJ2_9FIRM|nr:UDP-3-O-acyl-N-acetylglucosamine deacetylase [Selenihalanaerobacter shriftii]SJZ47443.1 UDP-3-O-[3-hydroxymyristoyl] N-acetylglucosamine deacetylase [Selenihalanaerobacter shriftii]
MRSNSEKQQTLKESISYDGVGLHTGQNVKITCKPLPADSGIIFKRVDLPGKPEIKAEVDNVVATNRSTTIGTDEYRISTVEHLLSALNGAGIDNLLIEINAEEVPVTDGSAKVFLELLYEAGIEELDSKRKVYKIDEIIWVREGDAYLVVLPFVSFKTSYTFVSEHSAIGNQFGEFIINEEVFRDELAPCRTFGFAQEIEDLQARGLALGGSLENAILIEEDEVINDLRFPDEIVRHKILDLVGDLSLIPPFKGHIIAVRSGHKLNVKLAKNIKSYLFDQ